MVRTERHSDAPAAFTVIGIGGTGCRVVSRLSSAFLPGVRLIAVDTDHLSVERSTADCKIYLHGADIYGSGGIQGWAERCADACADELATAIGTSRLVILVAGMGGGTGTGAIPRIAGVASAAGASVAALVTLPMTHESSSRTLTAGEGVMRLSRLAEILLALPLEHMLNSDEVKRTFSEFYDNVDARMCACLTYLLGFGEAAIAPDIIGLQVIRGGEEEAPHASSRNGLEALAEYMSHPI